MIDFFTHFFTFRKSALSEANSRDAMAIAALHSASFRHGWNEQELELLLTNHNVIAHRATNRGQLTGFIISRCAVDEAEILSVAVARVQRGKRLARNLLTLHLRSLASLRMRSVFLEVDEHNEPAMKLYRRVGFHAVGRRPNYYSGSHGKPVAALVLRRDL